MSRSRGQRREPVGGRDAATVELLRLDRLASVLDAQFRLPGTRFRFGWDPIVGIVPGIGDAVMLIPGLYILFRARALGLPLRKQWHIAGNLLVDWIIGSIPVIGVFFDAGYKANQRNIRILRQELARR